MFNMKLLGGGHFAAMDYHVCRDSHKKGIIITNSIEHAKKLEKLQRLLPQCNCKELIQLKGISVGWKNGNMKPMHRNIETYLRQYWANEGLLNDESKEQFPMEYERVSFVIFNGIEYRIGDLVVARMDGQEMTPLHLLGLQGT
jgi:hypothetical protein